MVTAANVDTIKSLVETIALAASGLWIAWTFHKLQSVRAAEAKIQNDLRAADKSTVEIREAERRLLSQQPNLEIAFTEVLEHRAPDGRRYLAVTVELQNSGARNLKVEFDQAPSRWRGMNWQTTTCGGWSTSTAQVCDISATGWTN
jgi:hypothetical protein